MNRVIDKDDINLDNLSRLFGNLDNNINIISKEYGVIIKNTNTGLQIIGEDEMVDFADKTIKYLLEEIETDQIDEQKITYAVDTVKNSNSLELSKWLDYTICLNYRLKPIKPKTFGQRKYISLITENVVTFGIGPAGTGKTFLAIAMAVNFLKNNQVSKIILTRPAVEAGENLGFLPGDLQEKIDPYLRPLYDSLYTILGFENFLKLKEKGIIEVAPLAYMRGRTLDNAFIILDEAQNSTNEQMKMFLTRIGYDSKAVITGDITQIDLGKRRNSGLVSVTNILKNIEGIGFSYFENNDVVRHTIVKKIIDAYSKFEGMKLGTK